jgi:hypothetical protein
MGVAMTTAVKKLIERNLDLRILKTWKYGLTREHGSS